MTNKLTPPQNAAAVALEAALNSVENGEAVEVAKLLVMLSAGFLRAVCGDDHVRGFLEDGLRELDKPPILRVVTIPIPGTGTGSGTKH